jgi:putative ABC transport system permease protein
VTPAHRGIDFGRLARPVLRRPLWALTAVLSACALPAVLGIVPGAGTTCVPLARATLGPDVRVTAVPGVDLRAALSVSGLEAASGPYPGVASSLRHGGAEVSTWIEARRTRGAAVDRPLLVSGGWLRRGGVVVEQALARRLDLQTGRRARVATTRGPRDLRVTGIAATSSVGRTAATPGLAYVLPQDLRRVAPSPVHGSTLLLRAGSRQARAVGRQLEQLYPRPQAEIARSVTHRCLP